MKKVSGIRAARSRDTTRHARVLARVAHIPTAAGCWVIRDADLKNRDLVAQWTRITAEQPPGVWTNPHWRSLVRRLYAFDFQAIAQGDSEAWVRIVVNFPESLNLEEICRPLASAVSARNGDLLAKCTRALETELRRRKKSDRAAVRSAWVEVHSQRAAMLGGTLRADWDGTFPSVRTAIKKITGSTPEMDGHAGVLGKYATTRAKELSQFRASSVLAALTRPAVQLRASCRSIQGRPCPRFVPRGKIR